MRIKCSFVGDKVQKIRVKMLFGTRLGHKNTPPAVARGEILLNARDITVVVRGYSNVTCEQTAVFIERANIIRADLV